MGDPTRVAVLACLQDLFHKGSQVADYLLFGSQDGVVYPGPARRLKYQVDEIVIDEVLVQLDDVGVVKFLQAVYLFHHFRLIFDVPSKYFDDPLCVAAPMPSPPDNRIVRAINPARELVLIEYLPRVAPHEVTECDV